MNKLSIVVMTILCFQFSYGDVSTYKTKQEPSLALLKRATRDLLQKYERASKAALMHYPNDVNLDEPDKYEEEWDNETRVNRNHSRMASLIQACGMVTSGDSSVLGRIEAVPDTQLEDKIISDFVYTIHMVAAKTGGTYDACEELGESFTRAPLVSDPKSFSYWLRYQTARFVSSISETIETLKHLLSKYPMN